MRGEVFFFKLIRELKVAWKTLGTDKKNVIAVYETVAYTLGYWKG